MTRLISNLNDNRARYVAPVEISSSLVVTGSMNVLGHIKFDPSQDPDLAGLDLDSTTLFQSSSNTNLGYDLYIRQNGNLVKWKWVEGVLSTGLLYGGVVTYSGSNVFVSPGSGIIAEHNATTGSEISPIVTYVTWNAITQSITNIATQQVTYLYIDQNGALQQQSTRFTNQQYHDYIPLGAVGHFDYTQVSAFGGQVQTAYDQVSQILNFVDAFGPLKISGYGLTGQAGSLQLSVGSGISFIHGGFYGNDPEFPSQISTPSQATASFAYVYTSGSGVRFDTNGGNLYTSLRPGWYDNGTGITGSVSNNDWTIQRAFSDAKTGVVYIYYGQTIYPDYATAIANVSTDPFTEGDTFDFTTFIGFLILKSNTTDITDTADNKIVPAGLFRGSGQGSGGGVAISNLDDLTDVSIAGPVDGEALIYNAGIWQNARVTASYVNQLQQNVIVTGSITAKQSGFNASGIFTGDTLGGIALTTTASNGFSVFTIGGALQIYDNTNAATRFTLASAGGITCNSVTASLQGTASYASTAKTISSQYLCQGILEADQTIDNASDTIIQYVNQYDPYGWYDAGSYRFVPTVAGYYSISAGAWLESTVDTNNQMNLQGRKNGSTFAIIQSPTNGVTGQSLSFTKIVYFNGTGDYMDLTMYQNSGASKSLLAGTSDGSGTWFSAHLIST